MRQTVRNKTIHQRFFPFLKSNIAPASLAVFFEIRTRVNVRPPYSDNEIVSPGFMTRSSAVTSRFFSSRANSSGVPVKNGNVP